MSRPRRAHLVPSDDATPEAFFEASYAAHARRVFAWALRFGAGDRAFAEDLQHDVFVRLYERLTSENDIDDVPRWLYRVTANVALDRLRRERSFWRRLAPRYASERSAPEAATPEELTLGHESAARALAALRELPARERVVLTMKLFDGRSQQEIAEALALTKGCISKVVARAWEKLRAAGWEVGDEDE